MSAVGLGRVFPKFGVDRLARRIDEPWSQLVSRVSDLPLTNPERVAYGLTLRRMSQGAGLGWRPDHVLEGCAICARELHAAFPGSDRDLMSLYYEALDEVNEAMNYLVSRRRDLQQAA